MKNDHPSENLLIDYTAQTHTQNHLPRALNLFANPLSVTIGLEEAGFDVETCPTGRADVLFAEYDGTPFTASSNPSFGKNGDEHPFHKVSRAITKTLPSTVIIKVPLDFLSAQNGVSYLIIYNLLVGYGYSVKYKTFEAEKILNLPYRAKSMFLFAFGSDGQNSSFRFPKERFLTSKLNDFINRGDRKANGFYIERNSLRAEIILSTVCDKDAVYLDVSPRSAPRKYYACPDFSLGIPLVRDNYGVRTLTPDECLALTGFSSTGRLASLTDDEKYGLASESVSPVLIKLIAENLRPTLIE